MTVSPIPEGYHSVTPYLIIDGAAEAIEFYKSAFGATEIMRLPGPEGNVMHAEVRIGDSMIMMADACEEMGMKGPKAFGGCAASICLYVEDVDAVYAQAIEAGGTEKRPLTDQFYGDRSATLEDPFGHVWTVSTHTEDLAPEVIQQRFEDFMKQQAPQ